MFRAHFYLLVIFLTEIIPYLNCACKRIPIQDLTKQSIYCMQMPTEIFRRNISTKFCFLYILVLPRLLNKVVGQPDVTTDRDSSNQWSHDFYYNRYCWYFKILSLLQMMCLPKLRESVIWNKQEFYWKPVGENHTDCCEYECVSMQNEIEFGITSISLTSLVSNTLLTWTIALSKPLSANKYDTSDNVKDISKCSWYEGSWRRLVREMCRSHQYPICDLGVKQWRRIWNESWKHLIGSYKQWFNITDQKFSSFCLSFILHFALLFCFCNKILQLFLQFLILDPMIQKSWNFSKVKFFKIKIPLLRKQLFKSDIMMKYKGSPIRVADR